MGERHLNFDEIIDRRGHNDLKYDFALERGRPKDVLPFWVADMDFRVSSYITDALKKQADYGVYGYAEANDSYYEALSGWFTRHFHFLIQKEWVVKNPSIVYTLAMSIQAFSNLGDSILIQQPVYYPFSEAINDNGRHIVDNPLVLRGGHYEIDFADFERKIIDHHIKVFLLCNPHNPTGRVFTYEELERMGDICLKHHVLVVSDEVHSAFTWDHPHIVFSTIKESFAQNCIICTSPSKTFNIAALHNANIIIPNKKIRDRFQEIVTASGYSQLNGAGLVACEEAYRHGDEWLAACLAYIHANLRYAIEYIHAFMPEIDVHMPEGTYLLWLNFSKLGMSDEELDDFIMNKAHLWLDSGHIFGQTGYNYQRLNVACPRATLKQGLESLKKAIESYRH